MKNIVTQNLSDFGNKELDKAIALLQAYRNWGLPDTSCTDEGLTLNFNTNSGFVWLGNAESQCFMINPETRDLEEYLDTPYNGHEGFLMDLIEEADDSWHHNDLKYLLERLELEGIDDDEARDKLEGLMS